nr:PREDICTED: solute carrier family 35 member C2 [Bemisia tabaci]
MARMVMDSSTSSEPLTPGSVLSKSHSLLTTISVIASYFVLSISLIYYQKWLIARCKFPLSIVTVHIILKFFLSAIFRKLWEIITSRKRKSLSWQNSILKIAPVGVTSGLDIGFSNWSLEFIAVSLYAMTKSTSVIFILFFALLLHLEEKSWSIVLIVMMISGGLAMFTYHSAEFHFIGFILALLGSISSGVRWTLSQFLMQRSEMGLKNPLDMMYHVQPWIFVSIIPLMLLFEGEKLYALCGSNLDWMLIGEILGSSLIAFTMEVTEYLVVVCCSSLTLSITGVVKEITTVALDLERNTFDMTLTNYLGLISCILGVISHMVHKISSQKDPSTLQSKMHDEAAMKFLSGDSFSSEDESGRDSPSVVLFSILQSRDDNIGMVN